MVSNKKRILLFGGSGKKKLSPKELFIQNCVKCVENCEKVIDEFNNNPNDFTGPINGIVRKCRQSTQLILDNQNDDTESFKKRCENTLSIWKECIDACENYSDNNLFQLLIDSCQNCISSYEKLFI